MATPKIRVVLESGEGTSQAYDATLDDMLDRILRIWPGMSPQTALIAGLALLYAHGVPLKRE